jgi:photosystem II stability/assembly factor-like uncharacterized protein
MKKYPIYLKKFIWIFALFLLFTELSFSQSLQSLWIPIPIRTAQQKTLGIKGGEGFQMVFSIEIAHNKPSICFLSTDTSQIWRSDDYGNSWTAKRKGFLADGARSIIIDPNNYNIIFAAGFKGIHPKIANKFENKLQGIFLSEDCGESWRLVKKTNFFRQKSKGCLFAFDSSSYVSNRTLTIYSGSYDEGLLKSDDGGMTWKSIGLKNVEILDMEENPRIPGEIFLATKNGLYRFYKGDFFLIGNGLPSAAISISLSTMKDKIIYAVTEKKGIFKSNDGGHSFYSINKNLPKISTNFTEIASSPINSQIVYVQSHESSNRYPYYSHDGGISWNLPKSIDFLNTIRKDSPGFWFSGPIEPYPHRQYDALTVSNGRGRILKTVDGGINWSYSGNGFTGGRMRDIAFSDNRKMLFSLTDHGVYYTNNGGDTFRQLPLKKLMNGLSSKSCDFHGNTIVVSLGSWKKKALAVSHDFGISWEYFPNLINSFDFLSFHTSKKNIIYAGSFKSEDKGKTWKNITHSIIGMYPGNGDIVYSILPLDKGKSQVLISYDCGETWDQSVTVCNINKRAIHDFAVSPTNFRNIYLATSNGLFLFNGEKWLNINHKNGLEKDYFGLCYLSSIEIDQNYPKKVYVGRQAPGRGQSNGIFKSTDGGLNWKNINYNFGTELSVWSIKVSPVNSTVFIGTSLGTWKLKEQEYIETQKQ